MTETAYLGLPFIEGSQAQKHVTHNEALRILDSAIQIAVSDMTLTAPPASPVEGERHVVASGATGAWAGHDGAIATWQDGAWVFATPGAGWCLWSVADGAMQVYDGTAWQAQAASLDGAAHLGINTTVSAPNLLSVRSNAALFTAIAVADGGSGDARVQISKEATSNTASVFFSNSYSGRAEFGLVGSDSFKLKVSDDGTSWIEALVVDPSSGHVTFPRGVANLVQGHISGLTLSTAGASSSFGVASGIAADETGVDMLVLSSAISKTTGAWAAGSGNGALDAGSIAAATWYHVHLVRRTDTGAVDALVSLSATAPILPASYTLSRRIGAMKTDGSAKWVKFVQDGDVFTWDVPASDYVSVNNPGTSAILRALSVPSGLNVTALFHARCYMSSTPAVGTLFTDPAMTDTTPDFNSVQSLCNTVSAPFVNLRIRTNASRQIRARLTTSASDVYFTLVTDGWIDRRGR
ncbi:MAG: DUF2793 domain-containing protein [Xanthobacteraceae bacterium]|nr:DUF2793 domain-containing protein [Xanthobacteraceae bacterium]